VDALIAAEDVGAIEVLGLHAGDLVPGNVGGFVEPSDPEDAQVPGLMNLMAAALSRAHLRTHIPMNDWCVVCQRAILLVNRRKDNPMEPWVRPRSGTSHKGPPGKQERCSPRRMGYPGLRPCLVKHGLALERPGVWEVVHLMVSMVATLSLPAMLD
jgi:hypothetical protein